MKAMLHGFNSFMDNTIDLQKYHSVADIYGPKINIILENRMQNKSAVEIQRGKDYAEDFLKKNPYAIVTASGAIYVEISAGGGAHPTVTSNVTVHYHGTLLDGTIFDSSISRNEPATFNLSSVIVGWQECIPLMKVGGKGVFLIPSSAAYGETGAPPLIIGGSSLIFEVELLNIQ